MKNTTGYYERKLDIKLRLKKCVYCGQYRSVKNMCRHIRECHPNYLPQNEKDKSKTKSQIKDKIKQFVCSQGCGAHFTRKYHLDRHEKSKNCFYNKVHVCVFCEKSFQKRESYWNHLNNRNCPKQFQCQLCKSFFKTLSEIDIHSIDCIVIND